MAPPDEAAHLFKAAAVVRGQWVGSPYPPPSQWWKGWRGGRSNPYVTVQVPAAFANAESLWGCYTFRLYEPASCAPKLGGPDNKTLVSVPTYVGRYPPLYYLLVGWPSLIFPSTAGVYLMRLVSALLSALFLASAFESALALASSRLLVLGVAAAATPMVFFLGSTINPNGLEVSAAICAWVSGAALVLDDGPKVDRRVLARTGVAAAVLVQMRGLSPLWLALIACSLLAVSRPERLGILLRDRAAWWWGAIVGCCSIFAVWWVLHFHALDQIGGVTYPAPTSTSLPHLTIIALGFTDSVVRGMIGLLGRPDTPGPSLTIYLWLGVVALLVGLGLVLDRRRRAWVLGGLLLLVVLLPAIFDVDVAKRYGFMWQGRYTLPLAVGIPILAGAIATGPQLGPSFVRRLRLLVPAALALAGTAMFLWGLWRYSVGEPPPGHPYRLSLDPFTGTWQPPLGALAVFLIFLVGLVVYSIWLVRNVPQPHLSIARPERPSADQHERGPVVESGERPTRSTIFGGQQGDGDVGAVDDPSPRS